MNAPPRTDPEKLQTARRAAAHRRAAIRAALAADGDQRLTVADVCDIAARELAAQATDPSAPSWVANMRLVDVLTSVPGIGPATAEKLMTEIGISTGRRLRGLVTLDRQRQALLDKLYPPRPHRTRPWPGWPYHPRPVS